MHERRIEFPEKVVNLTSPGWNSQLGKYFIGQTDVLSFGNRLNAWSGISNPCHSGVNLYFDIFTITNFGEQSFTAEIWLNATPPLRNSKFSIITPSNQAVVPPKRPKAFMQEADYLSLDLTSGSNIFDRIVPPNSTLVSDSHQGSIIIGQGDTFCIFLKSSSKEIVTSTIVLTWWEENVEREGVTI